MNSPRPAHRIPEKAVILLCSLIIVAGCLVHSYFGYTHRGRPGHAWGCDDAYISYRYAQNLVEGRGLVFNEGERVEGYSNFLYVLLCAPLVKISPDRIYFLSTWLNIFLLLAAFWLFRRHVRLRFGESESNLAGLLFALCPVLWVWTASGMESTLVLLLQIAIWIYTEKLSAGDDRRDFAVFAAVLVLALLSRVDGFLFPLIAIAVLALCGRYKTASMSLLVLVVAAAAYFGWRYSYYGDWLPNTYYVKVSGPLSERLRVAAAQLREVFFLKGLVVHYVLVAVAFFAVLANARKSRNPVLRSVDSGAVFVFGLLAYWFYVGGDVFTDRFLIFTVPVGLYSLAQMKRILKDKTVFASLVVIVLLFQATPVLRDPNFDYRRHKYDQWVTLGKYLRQKHPEATLAVDAAGKIPYFSRLYTIDMLGLNEPAIAHLESSFFRIGHNKFDADYVLTRKPDLIAAWGHPDRNMRFGLTVDKYQPQGYVIKYLVNSTRDKMTFDIVDVEEVSDAVFKKTYASGYQYFVLMRTGTAP